MYSCRGLSNLGISHRMVLPKMQQYQLYSSLTLCQIEISLASHHLYQYCQMRLVSYGITRPERLKWVSFNGHLMLPGCANCYIITHGHRSMVQHGEANSLLTNLCLCIHWKHYFVFFTLNDSSHIWATHVPHSNEQIKNAPATFDGMRYFHWQRLAKLWIVSKMWRPKILVCIIYVCFILS